MYILAPNATPSRPATGLCSACSMCVCARIDVPHHGRSVYPKKNTPIFISTHVRSRIIQIGFLVYPTLPLLTTNTLSPQKFVATFKLILNQHKHFNQSSFFSAKPSTSTCRVSTLPPPSTLLSMCFFLCFVLIFCA